MSTHVLKPPKLRRYHILESISSKTFIPREYQVTYILIFDAVINSLVCPEFKYELCYLSGVTILVNQKTYLYFIIVSSNFFKH